MFFDEQKTCIKKAGTCPLFFEKNYLAIRLAPNQTGAQIVRYCSMDFW